MTGPPSAAIAIDFVTAWAKVAEFIATVPQPGKHAWEIRDENTKDMNEFWLFSWAVRSDFWPKRRWAPTVGNGPIAVRKRDGAMFMWQLFCPWDAFVERIRSGALHPYGQQIKPQ
jgi:hypothetical protein